MPTPTVRSNRLRRAREAADMTQLDLAMASGIALGTISRLENGHNYPRKNVRQALADALGIDMDRLFPRPERKAS